MLTVLLLIPFAAALLSLFSGSNAKHVALGASLIQMVFSFFLLSGFAANGGFQYVEDYWWVQSLGISYKVAVDGISLLLVLLTTVLTPLIILSSYNHTYKNPGLFYSLVVFMEMALIGVFVSLDGFLFYVFWELALIPIYLICLMWGGERAVPITFKFFIYTLAGSLLMLAAFIYLYLQVPGAHSFELSRLYELRLSAKEQVWIALAFFAAFAIKIPVFPFHTWQPDTYADAPTPGTMLLSGIMLKMGLYGIVRWMIPVVPSAVMQLSPWFIGLAIIGVVYASIIAFTQKDLKRLIAYSSIAHVGLIAAGIFTLTLNGLQGGIVQMLNHGINVIGLFLVAEILFSRLQSRQLEEAGGLRQSAPAFSTYFMIIVLASVALPFTNGFIGELFLFLGLYEYNAWMAAAGGTSIILGAVYMLNAYKKTCLGEVNERTRNFARLAWNEKAVLIPVTILIFLFGIYPAPLIELSEPSIQSLLAIITNGTTGQ